MGKVTDKVIINLGCGFNKFIGAINVDLYGEPDVRWDLEKTPLPFTDDSADLIIMHHVLEHVKNWWDLFVDCSRVLKLGGELHINVPDDSSRSALTYRDHVNVFSPFSFHGCLPGWTPHRAGTNAWAQDIDRVVPLTCFLYRQRPYANYSWMLHWPFTFLLGFCARHMRNFIWEQIFHFRKADPREFAEIL